MASEPLNEAGTTRAPESDEVPGDEPTSKTASLTSETLDIASTPQAANRVDAPEIVSLSMTPEGIDIASHMGLEPAEPDLSLVAARIPASVERILIAIESVERTLREKRSQIEAIKARHETLAQEYRRLGTSLDAVSSDLARQCERVMGDLGAEGMGAKPRAADPKE